MEEDRLISFARKYGIAITNDFLTFVKGNRDILPVDFNTAPQALIVVVIEAMFAKFCTLHPAGSLENLTKALKEEAEEHKDEDKEDDEGDHGEDWKS